MAHTPGNANVRQALLSTVASPARPRTGKPRPGQAFQPATGGLLGSTRVCGLRTFGAGRLRPWTQRRLLALGAGVTFLLFMSGTTQALTVQIVRPTCDPVQVQECWEVTFEAVAWDERQQDVTGQVLWHWDFGDNTFSDQNPVKHIFGDPDYTITATATLGPATAFATMTATVTASSPAAACLSLDAWFGPGYDYKSGGDLCHDSFVSVREDVTCDRPVAYVEFVRDGQVVGIVEEPVLAHDDGRYYWEWGWVDWPHNETVIWMAVVHFMQGMPGGGPSTVLVGPKLYDVQNTVVEGITGVIPCDPSSPVPSLAEPIIDWVVSHMDPVPWGPLEFGVRLLISNAQGDLVHMHFERRTGSGTMSYTWRAVLDGVPPGVYAYRVWADHYLAEEWPTFRSLCRDDDKSLVFNDSTDLLVPTLYYGHLGLVAGPRYGFVGYVLARAVSPGSLSVEMYDQSQSMADWLTGQHDTVGSWVSDMWTVSVASLNANGEPDPPITGMVCDALETAADAAGNRATTPVRVARKPILERGTTGITAVKPEATAHWPGRKGLPGAVVTEAEEDNPLNLLVPVNDDHEEGRTGPDNDDTAIGENDDDIVQIDLAGPANMPAGVPSGNMDVMWTPTGDVRVFLCDPATGNTTVLASPYPLTAGNATLLVEGLSPCTDVKVVLRHFIGTTLFAKDEVHLALVKTRVDYQGLPEETAPTPNEETPGGYVALNDNDDCRGTTEPGPFPPGPGNGTADKDDAVTPVTPVDPDLRLIAFALDPGPVLCGGTVSLTVPANVKLWQSQDKQGLVPIGPWDLSISGQRAQFVSEVLGNRWVEGLADGSGDIVLLYAQASDKVTVTTVDIDVQYQNLPEFPTLPAAADEDDPGGYIGLNDNDDCRGVAETGPFPPGPGNGTADKDDPVIPVTPVDPDLRPITLKMDPVPENGMVTLTVAANLKVWKTQDKMALPAGPWDLHDPGRRTQFRDEVLGERWVEGYSSGDGELKLTHSLIGEDKAKITTVYLDVSFQLLPEFPEPDEDNPGGFVQLNDNDNAGPGTVAPNLGDGTPDWLNVPPPPLAFDDPDLQPTSFSLFPLPQAGNATLTVPSCVRLWTTAKKDTEVVTGTTWDLSNPTQAADFSSRMLAGDLWVEGVATGSGDIALSHSLVGEDRVKVTVFLLRLRQVTFDKENAGEFHTIRKDDDSDDYSAPHWQDNSSPLDGDADDAGDRKYPVAYTRNKKPKIAATFAMDPPPFPAAVIKVRGYGTGGVDIPETAGTFGGGNIDLVPTVTTSAVPDRVDYLNPLTIAWEVSLDGGTSWFESDKSQNEVFVVMGTPECAKRFRTVLYLACKNTGGTSPGTCLANTWASFSGPANVCGWKETAKNYSRKLHYYKGGSTGIPTRVAAMLADPDDDGNCFAWAECFHEALLVNNVTADCILVEPETTPTSCSKFGVKKIIFGGPSFPGPVIWRYAETTGHRR